MLTHISIQNFTIVDDLNLDLRDGMIVLTGETGAGKSIFIDALQYALGARGDAGLVRSSCTRASLSLQFDLSHIQPAKRWLAEHEFDEDEDCILRRTIHADGRSKHQINGQPCTQAQLRELGNFLIHIHGQHGNQALFHRTAQLALFDSFAQAHLGQVFQKQKQQVAQCYQQWQQLHTEKQQLASLTADAHQLEFLEYQLNEFEQLALQPGEYEQLEQTQRQLTHTDQLLQTYQQTLQLLQDAEHGNAEQYIHQAQQYLQQAQTFNPDLTDLISTLEEAHIQLQEVIHDLRNHYQQVEIDPEHLQETEQRLSHLFDLARKHRVEPGQLLDQQQQLQQQLEQLKTIDQRSSTIEQALTTAETNYQQAAVQLSSLRQQAAPQFIQRITQYLQQLGMSQALFNVALQIRESFTAEGLQQVEFKLKSNPGQAEQSLSKIASGGELSRISLAIQVVTQQIENTPTLVFDEIDVGVGGSTAEIIGQLLKQLGQHSQVLCITHLPQVAAQGQHHLKVSKQTKKDQTYSYIKSLNDSERQQEIARMLGGINITKHTLAHAKEMLENVFKPR